MSKKEKTLRELYIDKFGQLPMELDIWLQENVSKIEVDECYLSQILLRLVDLERLAKNHLAKADIPRTVKYLLDAIPDKIKNKYLCPTKKKKE